MARPGALAATLPKSLEPYLSALQIKVLGTIRLEMANSKAVYQQHLATQQPSIP